MLSTHSHGVPGFEQDAQRLGFLLRELAVVEQAEDEKAGKLADGLHSCTTFGRRKTGFTGTSGNILKLK